MISSPTSPSSVAQAAQTPPQGCLWRFLIPPISVLVMGTLLFLGVSQLQIGRAENSPPPQIGNSEDRKGIAQLFTPEVQAWEEEILIWSDQYMLDPNLVATVMQIESCGYAQAESPAGAKGLFQVMPYHFHDGEDPFIPETNAKRGLMYLRMSLERGGSTYLTLAGYNGGISGAQRPEEEWPDEVHRYVYWGLQIYQDAQGGKQHSPRLEEWLQRGGGHLCQQARGQ